MTLQQRSQTVPETDVVTFSMHELECSSLLGVCQCIDENPENLSTVLEGQGVRRVREKELAAIVSLPYEKPHLIHNLVLRLSS